MVIVSLNLLLCSYCDACLRAKERRDPFSLSNSRASQPFELVHCDVWGPYRTPSTCGARYFLTLVDDYSRGLLIYLLCNKVEVLGLSF